MKKRGDVTAVAETNAQPCRALESLRADILAGVFGAPGERFMTTRELAEVRRVSPVTAQHMLCALREERLVALRGKRYYLSHGLVGADTPLGRQSTRGHLIGLHVTTIDTPFFSALTHAAQKSADALGYRLLTAESGYDSAREREILEAFEDVGAAGILTCPGLTEDCPALYERYRLPHVFLGRKPPGVTGEAVLAHNAHGAARVAEHFIREGYRAFGYVGLAMDGGQDTRLSGYADALNRAGYALNESHILRIDVHAPEPDAAWDAFVQRLPRPAAVFCFHDLLAVNLLRSCRRLNVSVPRALAVAGFDNLPAAQLTEPPLTTVSYDVTAMAETAVRLLIAQIESGGVRDAAYHLEPVLIVRGSTSAAPAVCFRELHARDMLYRLGE